MKQRHKNHLPAFAIGILVVVVVLAGCENGDNVVDQDPDGVGINHKPNVPHSPLPADGAADVASPVTLGWSCSDPDGDSLRYKVYFGTSDAPPLIRIELADTNLSVGELEAEQTYYWRIEAYDPEGEFSRSPVWHFTSGVCDSVIGDIFQPPVISITQPATDTVWGTVDNVDLRQHKVVLWAKTDRWHIQPSAEEPYTPIRCDGSWTNHTNPWERILALIVDADYVPEVTNDIHPSEEFGVLAWDEYPGPSARSLTFSGWEWYVKSAEEFEAGPGPNYFSNSESAVWVDEAGLHLATEERDGKWFSSEVILAEGTGYGTYTYELGSRVDNLDFRLVFAGFLYETTNQEIDFEFSQSLVGQGHNAQYVVQPWDVQGNILRYTMPPAEESTHRLEWLPDRITWTSWRGSVNDEHPDSLIYSWTYTGPWNPQPDNERFRFNLWINGGEAPLSGETDHVLIRSFNYQP